MCTTLILLHLVILALTTKRRGGGIDRDEGGKWRKIEANTSQQLLWIYF